MANKCSNTKFSSHVWSLIGDMSLWGVVTVQATKQDGNEVKDHKNQDLLHKSGNDTAQPLRNILDQPNETFFYERGNTVCV